jgi:hypothetical protein
MIEATGETAERLTAVLALCSRFRDIEPRFLGWRADGGSLYLTYFDIANTFPVRIGADIAAALALEFLGQIKDNDWPARPDIDGSLKKGWKLRQDCDGVTISPFWMIYHK